MRVLATLTTLLGSRRRLRTDPCSRPPCYQSAPDQAQMSQTERDQEGKRKSLN